MTIQNSAAVRNAQGDAWEAAIGASARLRLYTGAQPSSCVAAEAGTLVIEYALASDWSPAASGGAKFLSSLPLTGAASSAGTIGHYRIYDSTGTTCHEQGTCLTSGGDMTIDNATVTAGQIINVTGFTKTWPGA